MRIRWWSDLYNDVKLTYARNRIVETHLFSSGVFPEKEHSRARIIFTKTFAFLSPMDDTYDYDTHATLEECQILTEAIQRHGILLVFVTSLHEDGALVIK